MSTYADALRWADLRGVQLDHARSGTTMPDDLQAELDALIVADLVERERQWIERMGHQPEPDWESVAEDRRARW